MPLPTTPRLGLACRAGLTRQALCALCAAAVLVAFLAPGADAARPRRPRPSSRPAKTARPKAPPATPRAAPDEAAPVEEAPEAPPAAPLPGDSALLTSFGLSLAPASGDLAVAGVLPGSQAWDAGIRPGDVLLGLGSAGTGATGRLTLAEAAGALRAWRAETRVAAAVRRGTQVVTLQTDLPAVPLLESRDVGALSPREADLQKGQLEAAAAAGPQIVRSLPVPHFQINAGQALWLRFPQGLAPDLREGAILEGETVTPLSIDEFLDYLVVPPRSPVWAQVVSAGTSEEAVLLKLHVHKIRLKGGHAYPVSARLSDVSGDHVLTRVSPGGTLVTAVRPQGKKRLLLLPPETRYKIELLEPLVIYEGPAFYLAGPGLWFKARSPRPRETVFEVTHVIPNRSAALAGLEAGDHVTYIGGVSADRLDFPAAIERLYGPAGTNVEVRVRRKGVGREESLSLRRGATHRQDLGFETLPVEGGLQVTRVTEDSPADKAGLRAGDAIIQFGSLPVNEIPEQKVREVLAGDLVEENELLVRRGSAAPFRASIRRGWVRVPLPPPYKP